MQKEKKEKLIDIQRSKIKIKKETYNQTHRNISSNNYITIKTGDVGMLKKKKEKPSEVLAYTTLDSLSLSLYCNSRYI